MTTEDSLGEGFEDAVRNVLGPVAPETTNRPPSGKLRVANLFYGAGTLTQAAIDAGMEVVYAHDPWGTEKTKNAYGKKFGLTPYNTELPNFQEIPRYDVVVGELREETIEEELRFVLRFLRARRPDAFVLVGPKDVNEQALATIVRERITGLGYVVASGGEALLGVYEPRPGRDAPVAVGLWYFDPIRLPVLGFEEPVRSRSASMIKVILAQIVKTFPK